MIESNLGPNIRLFLNIGSTRPLFVFIFVLFSIQRQIYSAIFDYKSIDGVPGIRTLDRRIVGADESTELWQIPHNARHIRRTILGILRYLQLDFSAGIACTTLATG